MDYSRNSAFYRRNSYHQNRGATILLILLSISCRCSSFQSLPQAAPRWKRPSNLNSLAMEDLVSIWTSAEALRSQHMPSNEMLLAQMYSAATVTTTNVKPATGHSQPLFGPPDPILSAGKSIPPSSKALLELGVDPSKSPDLRVAEGAAGSFPVLDASKFNPVPLLPGFSPTHGILPVTTPMPVETPQSVLANTQWSLSFINVIDRLPEVVFIYALVEFVFLRPNLDLYRDDIEVDRGAVAWDFVKVTAVRVTAFAVIAFLTNGLFGGS